MPASSSGIDGCEHLPIPPEVWNRFPWQFSSKRPNTQEEGTIPVSYSIDPERGLLRMELEGVVTQEDFQSVQQRLREDKEFHPNLKALLDATRMTTFTLDWSQVRNVLNSTPLGSTARRAFVAGPGLGFGFGRMVEILSVGRGAKTQVFLDEADALVWLGGGTSRAEER